MKIKTEALKEMLEMADKDDSVVDLFLGTVKVKTFKLAMREIKYILHRIESLEH